MRSSYRTIREYTQITYCYYTGTHKRRIFKQDIIIDVIGRNEYDDFDFGFFFFLRKYISRVINILFFFYHRIFDESDI